MKGQKEKKKKSRQGGRKSMKPHSREEVENRVTGALRRNGKGGKYLEKRPAPAQNGSETGDRRKPWGRVVTEKSGKKQKTREERFRSFHVRRPPTAKKITNRYPLGFFNKRKLETRGGGRGGSKVGRRRENLPSEKPATIHYSPLAIQRRER